MLKQILGDWKPAWYENRWRATLIAVPILCITLPLLILALPYLDVLNDMAVQPVGKPQMQYGHHSGVYLQVERPPVAGTMPMGDVWVPYIVTIEDEMKAAEHAGNTLQSPYAGKLSEGVLRQGQEIWTRICSTCHGPRGEANGRIQGPNLFPAPPSLHTPQALKYPPGRIWHIVTRGQNKMPSYADMLTPQERWAVAHYVRALQLAKQKAEGN